MIDPPRRSRLLYAALIAVTIVVGLASRKFSFLLPAILAKNAGDILYATMAFWLAGFLAPALPTVRAALYSLLFCFAIEFSQIYQAPWINAVRHNRLGGLILGFGFHVTDLLCYLIGVLLGVGIERSSEKHLAKIPGNEISAGASSGVSAGLAGRTVAASGS